MTKGKGVTVKGAHNVISHPSKDPLIPTPDHPDPNQHPEHAHATPVTQIEGVKARDQHGVVKG
ncbi:hypothetical protein [Heliophilum fasciatum]|uniref:Uncharacterized protein n=1 Tax=Heliophilum fasciatum TaxID=35700 RepID=A0A4V6NRP6_9FIRM|nr:hypothetical protein [Heliophilum fasciatum]MCW2277543.1 hypothetical protein [Heliophilum fasciatum]TCP65166.1 hypothetical protein EDD73_10649 [Heliophilum fasciatum]